MGIPYRRTCNGRFAAVPLLRVPGRIEGIVELEIVPLANVDRFVGTAPIEEQENDYLGVLDQ